MIFCLTFHLVFVYSFTLKFQRHFMLNENKAVHDQSLNVYSQSTSLLFQFILFEFITSSKKIQDIENIYSQLESLLIKHRLQADVDLYLNQLLDFMPFLTGSQMVIANEQTFPWTHQKGSLNKLRHYCYLLSHKFSDKGDVLNMNIAVSKAFHSALQIREVIFSLQRQSEDPQRVPNYVSLYHLLDKLIDNMRRASRLILRILIQFKDDENVLFFLLQHRTDLDQLYKTQFVARILKKMFSDGSKGAEEFLKLRYQERGFHHLIDSITNQISSVDACAISN
ncbi:MAG: hypothetical protein S4CHLAM7_09020 [Chlamydiae bacterium]|nr:hypothetical protein [Chlamydiota bacterium]